jgi:flavin reductase (DIM6/NTAB) family NADH-FMN oxidoreductase RutF
MFYEPHRRDRSVLPHDPFKAIVGPRPIGWISTVNAAGVPNLAPYSFFNAVADRPPVLMFSSDGMKHSAANALERGEFVVNLATYRLSAALKLTGHELPNGISEFRHAGLDTAPSRLVSPPRVADSPVSFECRVTQRVDLVNTAGADIGRCLVFGEVIGVHIDEDFLLPDGRVDTLGMRIIARAGYRDEYVVIDSIFHPDAAPSPSR